MVLVPSALEPEQGCNRPVLRDDSERASKLCSCGERHARMLQYRINPFYWRLYGLRDKR